MAVSYQDPFTGMADTTCSVSAHFMAKNAKHLKALGLTEAKWVEAQHLGTWGVLKGKIEAGQMPDVPFALWTIGEKAKYKVGFKNGNIVAHNSVTKTNVVFKTDAANMELFEEGWIKGSLGPKGGEWQWLGQHTPSPGAVSVKSESVGAMTDEDIATLFVKTKDELATAKGINIKGVNKQLDDEVFQAIANETGYTAKEVSQKIQQYKDSGKKLSALKKKTLPKKAPTVKPAPAVNSPEWVAQALAKPPDVPGAPTPFFQDLVAKKKEGWKKAYDSGVIDQDDLKYLLEGEATTDAAKAGQQAAKELLDDLNGPTHVLPTPPPKAVPTQAAEDTVASAVQSVEEAAEYLDEEVAKAYIKAKDQLAAAPDNPFTLYTQSPEFDDEIYNLMGKAYEIHLKPSRIKEQIAKYISEQKKLSVLKKQMAKSGEHTPIADTLKKKKGDPTGIGKTSKTQAQKDIADAAAAGYTPAGTKVHIWDQSGNIGKQQVFDKLSNGLYAGMQPQAVYAKIEEAHKYFTSGFFQGKNTNLSMLDMVRGYDELKAKQLGIVNGNFYEKKIAEYAASPAGKAQILAKQQAEELLKNLPPLPADSAGFPVVPVHEARARLTPTDWTSAQQSGLTTYTGGSYYEMNSSLRQGREKGSSLYRAIKNAQDGMRPVKEKILVHRGTNFSQFGVNSFEEILQLVGKTVQDKGFLSTSVGGRGAFSGNVSMEVEVPVGTHGVYVQPISNHKSENEFLIAAGTKYEVLTVSKTGYQTTVRVRAVPGSHTKGL